MGGKPYWVAGRLVTYAQAHWREIDGIKLAEGVDLLEVLYESPARFLNVLYVMATSASDETERAQLEFQLNEPPVWASDAAPPEELIEADAASFMAAMAASKRG